MIEKKQFYINGAWVDPHKRNDLEVINPATEQAFAVISLGGQEDANKAIAAAKAAFPAWSRTKPAERLALVEKIFDIYKKRLPEMAKAISQEMGAPIDLATNAQAASGVKHIGNFIDSFKDFSFERTLVRDGDGGRLILDPIGVVGLITPWNWPMNQVTLKVPPALLAGCTMVLKPSEIAPLSSMLMAEIIDEAGVPAGVFNLVNGDGPGVGTVLSGHKDIEMVSFTGSTRAGRLISANAAETLKRVCLELGGKGANIIFADADADAVKRGVMACYENSGQSCDAPTRMLVERSRYAQAVEEAKAVASQIRVGDPAQNGDHLGPVVSKVQFDKIQDLIQSGIDEGARLLTGGVGRPDDLPVGYYVRPTVFADVTQKMRIFNEEVFGPVLAIMPFDTEEEAIQIANNTEYGLGNYVQTSDREKARRIATQLRSGMVEVNGIGRPRCCFFGGVKLSGRAREGGVWGIEEFLDTKAISSW